MPRSDDPLGCPGCYTLHAYCDQEGCYKGGSYHTGWAEFNGEKRSECLRTARKLGWKFHNDGTATCPDCMARGKFKAK